MICELESEFDVVERRCDGKHALPSVFIVCVRQTLGPRNNKMVLINFDRQTAWGQTLNDLLDGKKRKQGSDVQGRAEIIIQSCMS